MQDNVTDILKTIGYPADLRQLPESQLVDVCAAVRQYIIRECSAHPGHFASSLGTVEITVALHYVFNTPEDRIVWDVGHQAYAHKILTGRREQFDTLRQLHGLKGFPSPAESEYDTFAAGHASNSISAALGMAVASHLDGKKNKVVAVIGDASISGGLAFEGLNNATAHPNNLLIILNDNRMAIDKNVGAFSKYLTRITTSRHYNQLRWHAYKTMRRFHLMGDALRRGMIRFTNSIKAMVSHQQNIFEGLDLRYFGPVDGHDVVSLVHTLRKIKDLNGPKLLHICTVKGKGFEPAEKDATVWHAPGKFDPETGERLTEDESNKPPRFQDVFGHTMVELAEQDKRIIGVTPAMPTGCSMNIMMEAFPLRSFDVGIAEEHAVTFSGGMAKEGKIPFCNIYSSFMQRAVDEVIHDVALLHLHVVFCLDRAGLVGADGPTHHGAFDLPIFRAIPGMTICSPINEHALRRMMYTAYKGEGPWMIRYPRGRGSNVDWRCNLEELPVGKGVCLSDGKRADAPEAPVRKAVLSLGPIGEEVKKAILLAEAQQKVKEGYAHYDMMFLKPIDRELLREVFAKYDTVVTVEDGTLNGGLGSAVLEEASAQGYRGTVIRVGIPDEFIEQGSVAELWKLCGMDAQSIANILTV